MRKFLIILTISLFSSSFLHSQERVFHAGLLGGLSMSQVLNDSFAHFSKLGFYGGGFVSSEFSDRWAWEIGMTYVMKGSKEQFFTNASYNGYKLTLGYVELPVLVKYGVKKWDFEIGLSFGILVNSKEENRYNDQVYSASEFEQFEFAGLIGFNYFFTEKVAGNIRLSTSILPIRYPTDNVYHPPLYGQRNNVLTFAVRYFIR